MNTEYDSKNTQMNFKKIVIGKLIMQRVTECGTEMFRICNFLGYTEEEVLQMYTKESLPTDLLMKWSKLLRYDFFRIYSQHLILYAPPMAEDEKVHAKSSLPRFRKNIYTKEIISFILDEVESGNKTKIQIMEEYKIPKTTLYKWIAKYKPMVTS